MNKTKLLISWWSWFIWSNLIKSLNINHKELEIYNLSSTHVDWTIHIPLKRNELFDFSSLENDFDYIIHTLALSSEKYCEDFKLAEKINIDFTKDILDFASKQKNLKKLIYFSSIMLYDNENISPVKETDKLDIFHWNYSFTKAVAEQYVKYLSEKQNIPFVILRLSNIYWPWQVFENSPFLIPSKIYEALTDWIINIRNTTSIRDFLFIDDAVSAVEKLLFSDIIGLYNLWTWKWISSWEIAIEIANKLNVKINDWNIPSNWPSKFYSDISLIQSKIDWQAKTNISEWIDKTIYFIKKQLNLNSN